MEEKKEIIAEVIPVADATAQTDNSETIQPPAEPSGSDVGADASDIKEPEETEMIPDLSGNTDAGESSSDETADGTDDVTLDADTTESDASGEEPKEEITEESTDTDTQEGENGTETAADEETALEIQTETQTDTETKTEETLSDISQLYQMIPYETEAVMDVPFLVKPLAEYTVSEGLLLLLFVLGLVAFVYHVLFD